MARVTAGVLPSTYRVGVSLDRYQELMGLPIAAFNGLNKPDEAEYACQTIWRQSERDYLAKYMNSAEIMREQELGFFMGPKYIVDEEYDIVNPLILAKKHLVAMGVETITSIAASVPLTLSGIGGVIDPVVIVVPTTLTQAQASQIEVCYPGESEVIHHSSISISGGNATINIPRSRLVEPALNDDRDDPLDYYTDSNFLTEVDVQRRYTDITHAVTYGYYDNTFNYVSSAMHPMVTDYRRSIIEAYPATYVGGVPHLSTSNWCGTCLVDRRYMIKVSYLSGMTYNTKMELETCRLAHSLMPFEPCSCDAVHQYWLNDVTPVDSQTMTPYGNTVGAVNAWIADSRQKIGFGGKFPNIRRGNE